MRNLINRNEIRRLEKAAREKDKRHLAEWAQALENHISAELQRHYENIYQEELANAIDTFILVIIYTLNRDSNINAKKGKLPFFLDNILRNIDRFRTGEVKKEDYEKDLSRDGIQIKDYHYHHRVTDIVVVVTAKGYGNKKKQFIKQLQEEQVIVLELDNTINRENEAQINKNIDMINMCTRMYVIGTSDDIETYITAAQIAGKPVLEVILEDENESI